MVSYCEMIFCFLVSFIFARTRLIGSHFLIQTFTRPIFYNVMIKLRLGSPSNPDCDAIRAKYSAIMKNTIRAQVQGPNKWYTKNPNKW